MIGAGVLWTRDERGVMGASHMGRDPDRGVGGGSGVVSRARRVVK